MNEQVYFRLKTAIENNGRVSDLIYEFLNSKTIEGNFVWSKIPENTRIIRLITSPEGKKWLHKHLDETLDYIASLAGV